MQLLAVMSGTNVENALVLNELSPICVVTYIVCPVFKSNTVELGESKSCRNIRKIWNNREFGISRTFTNK